MRWPLIQSRYISFEFHNFQHSCIIVFLFLFKFLWKILSIEMIKGKENKDDDGMMVSLIVIISTHFVVNFYSAYLNWKR